MRLVVALAAVAASLVLATALPTSAAAYLLPMDPVVSAANPGDDGDGVLEPGEAGEIVARLWNYYGNPMESGVSGTLSTDRSDVTVSDGPSLWPAFASDAIVSGAPPFQIALADTIRCGETIPLDLAMSSVQNPAALSFPVGTGPETSSTDPMLPRAIGTAAGFHSTVTLTSPGAVKDLRLRISRLDHTWVGDLGMSLRSPSGRTVTLMNSPGAGRYGATGDNVREQVLTDDGDLAIEDLWNRPAQYFTGRFRPDEPLAAFDGEPIAGTWTLHVWDTFSAANTGALHAWSIAPVGYECSTPRNDAPHVRPDRYVAAGAGAELHGMGVLANDADADNDALTIDDWSSPEHGSVDLAPDGSFTYLPDPDYAGQDSFSYSATDGHVDSVHAKVTISVKGPNYPPDTDPDQGDIGPGMRFVRGNVLDNDSDPNGDDLTVRLTGGGLQAGKLVLEPDGSYIYVPPQTGGVWRDSFDYEVSDGHAPPVVERAYFQIWAFDGGVPTPAPAVTPKSAKPQPESRAFANFNVQRATISGTKLRVRAAMSKSATGTVKASFRAGGRTSRVRAKIASGVLDFRLPLTTRQRRDAAGVLNLSYAGNTLTRPEHVSLNTGRRSSGLRASRAVIDKKGTLRVAGTIGRRARGLVRVHLTYSPRAGVTKVYDYKAKIRAGRWSVKDALPDEAIKAPGQVTIRYGGDKTHGLAGAYVSRDVGG